jgi:hypothetical protein
MLYYSLLDTVKPSFRIQAGQLQAAPCEVSDVSKKEMHPSAKPTRLFLVTVTSAGKS